MTNHHGHDLLKQCLMGCTHRSSRFASHGTRQSAISRRLSSRPCVPRRGAAGDGDGSEAKQKNTAAGMSSWSTVSIRLDGDLLGVILRPDPLDRLPRVRRHPSHEGNDRVADRHARPPVRSGSALVRGLVLGKMVGVSRVHGCMLILAPKRTPCRFGIQSTRSAPGRTGQAHRGARRATARDVRPNRAVRGLVGARRLCPAWRPRDHRARVARARFAADNESSCRRRRWNGRSWKAQRTRRLQVGGVAPRRIGVCNGNASAPTLQGTRLVGQEGLEPSAYGLKVRSSTD